MNYLADNLNYFVVSEKHTPIPINEDNFFESRTRVNGSFSLLFSLNFNLSKVSEEDFYCLI